MPIRGRSLPHATRTIFTVIVVASYVGPPGIYAEGGNFFVHKAARTKPPKQRENSDLILCGSWGSTPGVPQMTLIVGALNPHTAIVKGTRIGMNDGKARVMVLRRLGDRLDFRVDGVNANRPVTGASGWDMDSPGVPMTLGEIEGDLAEVLILRGAVEARTILGLEAGLRAKYGL
jgi:hypothetical protein